MPNGEQQEYKIKLGGQIYQFKADPGLSQEAAIDYASKKYPKFAEAYQKIKQPPQQPHFGFSPQDYAGALKMDQSKLPAFYTPMSPTGISVDPQHARTEATQLGAGIGGAGMGEFLTSLKAGGVVLPKIVQALYRAAGTGVGASAGAAASGAGPGEALTEGAKYGGMELGGEAMYGSAGAAFRMFRRLFGADPARLGDLGDIIKVEDDTIKSVQEKAPEIRKAINETYPEVNTPVRIMPPAKVAQTMEKGMVADPAPGAVSRVADIGRARQSQALRLLSRARVVMESSPEGASDEVRAILDKAKQLQGIDFRDAQKLYSALGRAAAKGGGWKLSGEQIHALNEARDAMESSMKDALTFESQMEKAAKAAGVMPEGELGDFYRFRDAQTGGSFSVRKSDYSASKLSEEAGKLRKQIPDPTQMDPLAQQKRLDVQDRFNRWQPADKVAQWEKAQAAHKQFIDDFNRPGGALTAVMDAEPGERGKVLEHLLANPATRARATQALQRYGFNVQDILRLATKYRDPVELHRVVADAARLEQVGQDIFGQQEGAALRKKVGRRVLKYGIGAAGAGAAGAAGYELWRMISGQGSPRLRD